jgi:NADH:ubiquinone oxidoreductase subunit 5 (subunit L)/multisubunit Na+/H+ antiporter MnhA subunit
MSLTLFLIVAFGGAGLALIVRVREHLAIGVGLVALAALIVAAIGLVPGEALQVGGGAIVVSEYVRLFLVLGSVVGLGLALAGVVAGSRRDAPAATLAILGACALTLAVTDPRAAVLVATAGGLFGVLVTLVPASGRSGSSVGIRETRAVVVAGTLAIAATAWFGRDLSQLAAQPVVFGLAYLAFAIAVAIRFGAIPFHLWAARLADAAPETTLPILTALAPAAFAVVALAWVDASVAPLLVDLDLARDIVLAIAIGSIVLAAFAAFVQDDLEHVVGYSIVGDAGVVILALAALDPAAWAPARIWVLAFVVAKGAFAAWAGGIRTAFWTGRIPDLRGWATRAPVLAVALALVTIASVGVPGLLAFEARATLVDLALDPPFASLLLVATLAPILYYARLFAVGLSRPDRAVDPGGTWRPSVRRLGRTKRRAWLATTWSENRAFMAAILALVLAIVALATAAGAFGLPGAAAGLPTGPEGPTELVEP